MYINYIMCTYYELVILYIALHISNCFSITNIKKYGYIKLI